MISLFYYILKSAKLNYIEGINRKNLSYIIYVLNEIKRRQYD